MVDSCCQKYATAVRMVRYLNSIFNISCMVYFEKLKFW
jgi:hypothetical protein